MEALEAAERRREADLDRRAGLIREAHAQASRRCALLAHARSSRSGEKSDVVMGMGDSVAATWRITQVPSAGRPCLVLTSHRQSGPGRRRMLA